MSKKLKELYSLKREVDKSVKENFGYCPNNKYFEEYEKYIREVY